MDQQYEPQDQSDELPYWPLYGTDLVFEWTVSEVVMSLAARIPSELFENILFYVNVDRVSQRTYEDSSSLIRNRGEPSTNDVLADLKRCSLVCLFWANRCRRYMFSDRPLEIKSYEDAKIFRQYIVGGSSRLTPVHRLISGIRVRQDYGSQRSFLHLLYLPAIQDKLKRLYIHGPVPEGFNPAKLDTPHWGIPPSIAVPSSFLLHEIYLIDIHLPSFYHIIKYIKHFACATCIRLVNITWDGQTPIYSLPHASNTIPCRRRPRSLEIVARGDCTNSLHLALTAVMMNPNCPLHRLSDEERARMIKFMTLLCGDNKDPHVWIEFNISEQTTTMRMHPFHFVFEEASATDRSAFALSVVGMHAYISYASDDLLSNFDALAKHARTHPTIRAFVLLFSSLDFLQESLKPFVEVLALATETIELVLAYEEVNERRAVGVDLATLELNGRIDTWDDEESKDYWGGNLSSQMLQRQLKKKRWMSVH